MQDTNQVKHGKCGNNVSSLGATLKHSWSNVSMYAVTTILISECQINPLTAGAFHIRFLHFLLAHYISAIKHINDKK